MKVKNPSLFTLLQKKPTKCSEIYLIKDAQTFAETSNSAEKNEDLIKWREMSYSYTRGLNLTVVPAQIHSFNYNLNQNSTSSSNSIRI